jgi:amidohydrolase
MIDAKYKEIINEIDNYAELLWSLSTNLFNNPEIAFKEFKAHKLLTETLGSHGYHIEEKIGELDTAFRAKLGDRADHKIAILAEYDALVGLGHACGHNLIASAAVGAGLGLAPIIPKLNGQVQIIGTPAEEGGGGKVILAEAGIFKDIDAALMFHPASKNMVLRKSLASCRLTLEFYGKASHAAAAPEEGINALDALILTFNSINAMRSTLLPKDRIAGIIKHGGEAANIIPAYASAEFSVRALQAKRRDKLVDRVIACAQAGAESVGCQLKYELTPGYMDIIPNHVLAGIFQTHLEALGRVVVDPDPNERMGSTDMGDVSHLVPAIHPYLAIAPINIAGHTEEFKAYSISEAGRAAMLDAAKAIAMTTYDLLYEPDLLQKAKEELATELESP